MRDFVAFCCSIVVRLVLVPLAVIFTVAMILLFATLVRQDEPLWCESFLQEGK